MTRMTSTKAVNLTCLSIIYNAYIVIPTPLIGGLFNEFLTMTSGSSTKSKNNKRNIIIRANADVGVNKSWSAWGIYFPSI